LNGKDAAKNGWFPENKFPETVVTGSMVEL
jgi:hypothetical protein